jgi:hypothetical protein
MEDGIQALQPGESIGIGEKDDNRVPDNKSEP